MIQSLVVRRSLLVGLAAALLTIALHASGLAAQVVTPGIQSQPAAKSFTYLPLITRRFETMPVPNCKYGVAVNRSAQTPWVERLGAGWYLTFGPDGKDLPAGSEFARSVRIRQDKLGCCTYLPTYKVFPSLNEAGLGGRVKANPGSLWLIGNEPDRGPHPPGDANRVQDDTYPEVYARSYHDIYKFIKLRDPSARIAIAGLVQVTPQRLQYLDKVWNSYTQLYGADMPVDVWNMHLYILPESKPDGTPNGIASHALGTDPALGIREGWPDPSRCFDPTNNVYCWADHDHLPTFIDQVRKMRTWMKIHGQQNKPLILSEYSLLYPFEDYDNPVNPTRCFLQDEFGKCFTPARVSAFMTATFDYFESNAEPALGYPRDGGRLVQRWLWYALEKTGAGGGAASDLLTSDSLRLTQVGQTFKDNVASRPRYVNLVPDKASQAAFHTARPTDTITPTLSVDVVNAGSIQTPNSFTVTFYADSSMTQPIGTATVDNILRGCEIATATASVAWSNLAVGTYPFWARVDSGEAVAESDESDNVIQGSVTIYPGGLHLPIIIGR